MNEGRALRTSIAIFQESGQRLDDASTRVFSPWTRGRREGGREGGKEGGREGCMHYVLSFTF